MAMAFPSNPTGARRNAKTSVSSNQVCFIGETIAVTATQAGTVNTLLGTCRLPYGAEVVGVVLNTDTLDSNVSKAIVLAVGDATTADRLMTGLTTAQAGGVSTTPKKDAIGYQYTGKPDTLIQVKITTAAATGAAGTLKYGVFYVTN